MSEVATIQKTGDEIAREAMQTPAQIKLTAVQKEMEKLPQIDCPLIHRFTPKLYIREIFMPKGTLIISKIHKTEHPFVVTKGVVSVWIEGVGIQKITAPYTGITLPGTRRVLYIHEDCSWITFHPTDKTTPEEVVEEVTYNQDNDFIDISPETMKQLQEAK